MSTATRLLTVLAFLTLSLSVFAQRRGGGFGGMGQGNKQRIRLEFYGQEFRKQSTIKIKQQLRQQGYQIGQKKLMRVILVAKSRMGRGQATLMVGGSPAMTQNVPGHPGNFDTYANIGYQRVPLKAPSFNTQGAWQIKMRGNIKVQAVVVVLQKKRRATPSTLTVSMHGQVFRGAQTIKLKQMIAQQYPGVNLANAKLSMVTVQAKSKRGHGTIALRVGPSVSHAQTVLGNQWSFQDNSPYSYFQTTHFAPGYNSVGAWQLQLQGAIKVSTITVQLQPQFPRF